MLSIPTPAPVGVIERERAQLLNRILVLHTANDQTIGKIKQCPALLSIGELDFALDPPNATTVLRRTESPAARGKTAQALGIDLNAGKPGQLQDVELIDGEGMGVAPQLGEWLGDFIIAEQPAPGFTLFRRHLQRMDEANQVVGAVAEINVKRFVEGIGT